MILCADPPASLADWRRSLSFFTFCKDLWHLTWAATLRECKSKDGHRDSLGQPSPDGSSDKTWMKFFGKDPKQLSLAAQLHHIYTIKFFFSSFSCIPLLYCFFTVCSNFKDVSYVPGSRGFQLRRGRRAQVVSQGGCCCQQLRFLVSYLRDALTPMDTCICCIPAVELNLSCYSKHF